MFRSSNQNEGDYVNMNTADILALANDAFKADAFKREDAIELLNFANGADNPMDQRILAESRAEAIRKELQIGKSRIGTFPGLGDNGTTSSSTSTSGAAAKNDGKPRRTATKTKPAAEPVVPGFIYVANALQAWAFEHVLVPNVTKDDGHFTKNRPDGHAEWAKHVKGCIVDPDGKVGITNGKSWPKRNYNLNDSTWLKPDVLNPMLKAASKALGRDITKKEMVTDLEQLKKILGMDVEEHEVKAIESKQAPAAEPETEQAPAE